MNIKTQCVTLCSFIEEGQNKAGKLSAPFETEVTVTLQDGKHRIKAYYTK